MKALLITAHGSRRNESNEEVIELASDIEKTSGDQFDFVRCAFIQFTTPSFHTQIDDLVDKGATQIIIFPYFIAAGSHVLFDIPKLIQEAKVKNPNIEFKLTPHLGKFHGIKNLILEEVIKNQKLVP